MPVGGKKDAKAAAKPEERKPEAAKDKPAAKPDDKTKEKK
jgi:hypothetical protein